jgi:hypothetical protein
VAPSGVGPAEHHEVGDLRCRRSVHERDDRSCGEASLVEGCRAGDGSAVEVHDRCPPVGQILRDLLDDDPQEVGQGHRGRIVDASREIDVT